ncbi:hypothetical protein CSB45_04870 [candidate division KSB3 bacterium]|uniref:Organic solvent tolerance-like N-terminal domain-containing protein n=1 Tax=candidate division KSB3 bacterium TaxID=2044937 RepID=A0A2G6E7J1_9BACT|nr:MAG: hypothetical protein CSB45_04870 [candidate division KSB3 bacterium]PIE30389.1 MAG: hypothetical protein CSA57_03640 [candidate division KSB3 bacterium]
MNTWRYYLTDLMCCFSLVLGVSVFFFTDAAAQENGSGPLVITGDDLEIDSKNKVAVYRGNVKVVQGQTTMFSDELEISLDDSGTQLKQAVAAGNVRIVNEDLTATGGEGTFYNQEQKIVLIDKAKVWQGHNAISAPRIVAYLNQEVLEGYSSGANGRERTMMTIYSAKGASILPVGLSDDSKTPTDNRGDDAQLTKHNATSDAAADESVQKARDKKSPTTIEADDLRFDNKAQQARFRGEVTVVNDTTKLFADEMIVYITQLPEGGNDVEKIDVSGHVKIVSETQTVTGDKGFFWNIRQRATIEGRDGRKARIEDSAQDLVLEAPVVKIDLATNKVTATQAEGGGERIRTTFGTDESQLMIGPGTSGESEDTIERYIVTKNTLKTLKDADVPDDVLDDLSLLQDREFRGKKAFLEGLKKRVDAELLDRYKKLVLKHSRVERSSHEQDLPSVTIQPDTLDTSGK